MKKGNVFFLIMLFVSGIAFAQNIQELRIGSFLSGSLGRGQEIWYSVRTQEAGFLVVETTGNTDTFLEAYDNDYNYITYNDDDGEGANACIEIFVRSNSTYFFKVTGYGGTATGQFRILAALNPLPPVTELRTGSFVSGNINSGEERWYSVRASQSGYIIVEVTGVYSYLEIYDEYFNYLGVYSEGYSSSIRVNASAGQSYNFYFYSYDNSSFRVTASYEPFPEPVQMSIGTFQNGYIDYNHEYWYSVRTASRGLLVVETTGSTDTVLFAYDGSYNYITSNDDYYDSNARVEIHAEANQTYIFMLKGYGSHTAGSYRIFAGME